MTAPRWKITVSITILTALTVLAAWYLAMQPVNASSPQAVITYHYDSLRTGWNSNEGTLTPSNVKSSFNLLQTVALDEQVDAQPLVVPNQTITGGPHPGTYEVVYVVTENNTVYAINAANGMILLTRTLGTPVPKPLGCTNNSAVVGITSTPVIDPVAGILYVVSKSVNAAGTSFYQRLHAIDLASGNEKRIERYFLRKMAYKLFGKFMGKTINKI